MKELYWLNEAVVWSFLAGIAATGFFLGVVFRLALRRNRHRKQEKTVYLAALDGTVPLEALVGTPLVGDDDRRDALVDAAGESTGGR